MAEQGKYDTTDSKKISEEGNLLGSLSIPLEDIDAKFSKPGTWFSNKTPVQMPVGKYEIDYNMDHISRGKALIFNNKYFEERLRLKDRRGTDKDRDNFKAALLCLGFTDITIREDYSAKQIKNELETVASLDHTYNDCLVVAIFTHGDQGYLYGSDKKFTSEELWQPFLGNVCKTLVGKPKLFFIQACQGDNLDDGVKVITAHDGPQNNYKIPAHADILISYSTVPGYYSWRNTEEGSWFIQALSSILIKFGDTLDLISMLTLVNQKVALDFESYTPNIPNMHQRKQVPCISSMLMRRVFFPKKSTQKSTQI